MTEPYVEDTSEKSEKKALDLRLTGKVQGVQFRSYAREQAGIVGIFGWVRNNLDGSVSLHLEGRPDGVDAYVEWARRSPESAEVADLEVSPAEVEGIYDFTILD